LTDVKLHLIDIVERARRIERYLSEGRDAFDDSDLIQDAVIRNLEVIGEAAKGVPDDFRAQWPTVPWRRLAGFRDILIHAYRSVRMDTVWNAAADRLPDVRRSIEQILTELEGDPESES
jgi:uncharacterized protein with HEPN domain